MPALKVWATLQVLAWPRFKEAITEPVVGEMVKVPSEFVTDETPPWMQVPPVSLKQPAVSWMPLEKVLVAAVPVTERLPAILTPPAKVLVAEVPATFKLLVTESVPMVEVAPARASIVPVAIKAPAVVVPETRASPVKERVFEGVVVPIARLPEI